MAGPVSVEMQVYVRQGSLVEVQDSPMFLRMVLLLSSRRVHFSSAERKGTAKEFEEVKFENFQDLKTNLEKFYISEFV
jgi:hypothetical protein